MLRWSPFVVVLAACGSRAIPEHPSAAPAPAAAMHSSRRPDTAALARDIPRLLEVSGVPGLSMAVVQDGRVTWARGFGTANDSARTPVNTETIFEAASLSKPVFAYLVLRLADRGEFNLDRPLFEMLEYPRLAQDERSKRITARMVLSHGTGLPNWGGAKLTLQFDPGTAYGYSGEGFVYLQKVVEQVTGRPLDQLARREVFEPLGMTRSSYVWQDRFAGNAAYARDWLWRVAPANHYMQANAAASLLTTATDYARFVGAVLTGRGLSPTMWRAFLTPVRETSPGISVGLGIRVEDGPAGRTFYHSGNNGRRFHLLHDRRPRAGHRLRLLHQRIQRHVARRGTSRTRPRQRPAFAAPGRLRPV
jgi:CubicO group peptidase (beta-lactamase class C family)